MALLPKVGRKQAQCRPATYQSATLAPQWRLPLFAQQPRRGVNTSQALARQMRKWLDNNGKPVPGEQGSFVPGRSIHLKTFALLLCVAK